VKAAKGLGRLALKRAKSKPAALSRSP
jgi:hypothetical protein